MNRMKPIAKTAARLFGFRRQHAAHARLYGERHWLATVKSYAQRNSGRILCYHSVGQPEWGANDVSPERFRRQIEQALALGFRFVRAEHIARNGGQPKDLAITFDDGCSSVLAVAAPILRGFGVPWTLFVVSDWSSGRHPWSDQAVLGWREIDDCIAAGGEIGSHSVTHPDFGKIGPEQTADELERSRADIATHLGFAPTSFAIPFGQSKNWPETASSAARKAGYSEIYAQAELTRCKDTIPRTFITQIDDDRVFKAALGGAFDNWEEWF